MDNYSVIITEEHVSIFALKMIPCVISYRNDNTV